MSTEEELKSHRRKRRDALPQGYPSFAADAETLAARDRFLALAQNAEACAALPTEEDASGGESYALFGRVMALRGPFVVFRTPSGDAQALVRKEALSETDREALAQLDLGDHAWVSGVAMKTRTQAAALRATQFRVLGKAMLPPPAKWHGLKDVEKRYRERYVDLFANVDVAQVFRARSMVSQQLRQSLVARGFLEVETPLLHSIRGGATATPFRTHHAALDLPLYLRIAPELYLKRLVVGGLERVFELGRNFRNEGISTRHNPEFTMLELYMAYANVDGLIALLEAMIREADEAIRSRFPHFAETRSFALPSEAWPRVTIREAVKRAVEAPEAALAPELRAALLGALDDATALEAVFIEYATPLAKALEGKSKAATDYGHRLMLLFECLAEPRLEAHFKDSEGRSLPVFVTEFPVEVSPLSRQSDTDPRFTDRFELFLEGRELANGFNELNDPEEQAKRFQAQLDRQAAGDAEAMDFDQDYVRALEYGLPPTAGLGIGVDRLVMSLCGQASIRDVLLFPLLRPQAGTEHGED